MITEPYTRGRAFKDMADLSSIGQGLDSELDKIAQCTRQILSALVEVAEAPDSREYVPEEVIPWAPDTRYKFGAVVSLGFSLWVCKRRHVSAQKFEGDQPLWTLIFDMGPLLESLQGLANTPEAKTAAILLENPHIVRISRNLGALMALSESIPAILELRSLLDGKSPKAD